ncbi:MAG: helix-turn-helix transcriptional regulator [Oscillospiraceae bacterium]|nr:helix-turn-helix transcriptional regulator [Oscillospiraceae bacterium]
MTFPERIAAIRKDLKLSQDKFGELANVSQRTVAFWEAGQRMPSHAVISSLADRLGVSVDYLLGRTDEKAITKQPAAHRSELVESIISRVQYLSDPALSRLSDFLDGLRAGQETAAPPQAAPRSDAQCTE